MIPDPCPKTPTKSHWVDVERACRAAERAANRSGRRMHVYYCGPCGRLHLSKRAGIDTVYVALPLTSGSDIIPGVTDEELSAEPTDRRERACFLTARALSRMTDVKAFDDDLVKAARQLRSAADLLEGGEAAERYEKLAALFVPAPAKRSPFVGIERAREYDPRRRRSGSFHESPWDRGDCEDPDVMDLPED